MNIQCLNSVFLFGCDEQKIWKKVRVDGKIACILIFAFLQSASYTFTTRSYMIFTPMKHARSSVCRSAAAWEIMKKFFNTHWSHNNWFDIKPFVKHAILYNCIPLQLFNFHFIYCTSLHLTPLTFLQSNSVWAIGSMHVQRLDRSWHIHILSKM